MKKIILIVIFISTKILSQNPVHFESPFIFLELGITPDTLILGYDSFATDSLDPTLGEVIVPQVPGTFGVRFQLPSDTSIYTKKDFRFGCGRPDYHEYLVDIESGYSIEIIWDWQMIYSVTFINPYSGHTLQTIDFGNPATYYIDSLDKIILGVQYDGPLSWPTYQVVSPNGGETLISGENFLIIWTNSFLPPGKLWYSSDAGMNWSVISDNLPSPYNSFSWQVPQIDSDSCLIRVGYFPCAYDESNNFFTITIPNNVEDEMDLPTEFSLSQNYPNPFNPTTKIKFTIPASLNPFKGGTLVQLRVYDILGREVKVLVNEEKQSGVYEIEFDGSSLSGGVYFYRLTARDPSTGSGQRFSDTKKLVLIK